MERAGRSLGGGLQALKGSEFESLLHRQILKTQSPYFSRESRGFVVFGVQKMAPWDHHGTGALFWCENLSISLSVRWTLHLAVDPDSLPWLRPFSGFVKLTLFRFVACMLGLLGPY